jgi:hypothetical protein
VGKADVLLAQSSCLMTHLWLTLDSLIVLAIKAQHNFPSGALLAQLPIVHKSLLRAPVTLYLVTLVKMTPHPIKLFLNIAFMLITTGQTNHATLSNILVLLFPLIYLLWLGLSHIFSILPTNILWCQFFQYPLFTCYLRSLMITAIFEKLLRTLCYYQGPLM